MSASANATRAILRPSSRFDTELLLVWSRWRASGRRQGLPAEGDVWYAAIKSYLH